jgi:hypothetical protein
MFHQQKLPNRRTYKSLLVIASAWTGRQHQGPRAYSKSTSLPIERRRKQEAEGSGLIIAARRNPGESGTGVTARKGDLGDCAGYVGRGIKTIPKRRLTFASCARWRRRGFGRSCRLPEPGGAVARTGRCGLCLCGGGPVEGCGWRRQGAARRCLVVSSSRDVGWAELWQPRFVARRR